MKSRTAMHTVHTATITVDTDLIQWSSHSRAGLHRRLLSEQKT